MDCNPAVMVDPLGLYMQPGSASQKDAILSPSAIALMRPLTAYLDAIYGFNQDPWTLSSKAAIVASNERFWGQVMSQVNDVLGTYSRYDKFVVSIYTSENGFASNASIFKSVVGDLKDMIAAQLKPGYLGASGQTIGVGKVYFKKGVTKKNSNVQTRTGDCTILTTQYAENEMGGSKSYDDIVKVFMEWEDNPGNVTAIMVYGISYQDYKFIVGDLFTYDESKRNSTGLTFYKDAINVGSPIISAIPQPGGQGHAVMIVGYNQINDNLIYFDPAKSRLQEAPYTTFNPNVNFILQSLNR